MHQYFLKNFKGQLISKANYQAVNSSKKWTNEFVFTTMRRVFLGFLEEIEDAKQAFRNYLTFSTILFHFKQNNIWHFFNTIWSRKKWKEVLQAWIQLLNKVAYAIRHNWLFSYINLKLEIKIHVASISELSG